jgi:carbamoyltransferase
MTILGIHDGHNASAALMTNGKIQMVVQEERVTKEKNRSGFPARAIELILKTHGISAPQIDKIGMNGAYMPKDMNRQQILEYYDSLCRGSLLSASLLKNRLKNIPAIARPFEQRNRDARRANLKNMNLDAARAEFIDHHLLHASSAYYGCGNFEDDILVLTNDGAGDRICATVNIGSKGKLKRIAEVHENHSVGILYAVFTFLTGMVPLEHEYKLMGMAPYADKKGTRKIADLFWNMFEFAEDGLTWQFKAGYSVFASIRMFKEFMYLKRFDHLMGGLQLFIEEFMTRWVAAAVKKTGIRKIALAGGTFMNVKANQKIMNMDAVESIFVFPSSGDESNAIGACYYLAATNGMLNKLTPLQDIYWGISYSNEDIKSRFDRYKFSKHRYKIDYIEDIEKKVSSLLKDGHVVARFKGKEEFGARSLGNRALLANPSKPDVIKEINEMIKNRDFWMPFASSVIDYDLARYVKINGKNSPHYMIMTYDTTADASDLEGGRHPYDKTIRPQLVTRAHNPSYWSLIDEFKKQTGIGGLVNTSLNLHGLPLVHEPEDAFHILEESRLKFLASENYLIEKLDY